MSDKMSYSTNVMNQTQKTLMTRSLAGSRAKILKENGKLYVVIDGKKVEADRNDLFGINKSNINEYLERLVAAYDEQIAKNKERISFLEKMEMSIKATMKIARKKINNILAKCNVSNIGQIQDKSLRSQAIEQKEFWWNQKFKCTSVNNQIHSAYTDNFIATCDKGDLQVQMSFNDAIAQRLSCSA